jgi:hypothetical protein
MDSNKHEGYEMSANIADINLITRVLGYAVTVEGRRTEYFRTETEAAEFAERTARGLGWTAKQDDADWVVSL